MALDIAVSSVKINYMSFRSRTPAPPPNHQLEFFSIYPPTNKKIITFLAAPSLELPLRLITGHSEAVPSLYLNSRPKRKNASVEVHFVEMCLEMREPPDVCREVAMDDEQNIHYDVLMLKIDVKKGHWGLYNFYKMQVSHPCGSLPDSYQS